MAGGAGPPRLRSISSSGRAEASPLTCSPKALVAALVVLALWGGCAKTGFLSLTEPVAPEPTEAPADSLRAVRAQSHAALFGDTLVGFRAGSGDSALRFLGRLRDGYVADTLNVFVLGDNRPGYESRKLKPQLTAIESMASWNPLRWLHGLVSIPILLVRGTFPNLVMWRDLPSIIRNRPKWGREEEVVQAMLATIDSLKSRNQMVSAIINTGDLVRDGRIPEHWQRFLAIVLPLAKQVSYFPIAGNHERTDTPEGVHNWHTATGLPVSGERLYYCFDSADGWVRFVALDSNPMTDTRNMWSREVEVKYSEEQFTWLTSVLKDHWGPALVFLHHPPFSLGFHRSEWQADDMLQQRRAQLVRVLRESGLSVIAAGHEHAYERALLSCGDAVLIYLVAGGGGSPLHEDVASGPKAGEMFAAYDLDDCEFKPENVLSSQTFHFIHLRFWYGGGDFHTYAVDDQGKTQLIDNVEINLQRYGVPEIDQFKVPIPPKEEDVTQPPPTEESAGDTQKKKDIVAKSDSISASERILSQPPPAAAGEKKGAKSP